MSHSRPITLTIDRRILEHPQALHLRRMRIGIWLYLDLLTRLPAGAGTLEVAPEEIAQDMGLPEGTIRSWLGHLRKAGYVRIEQMNGTLRATIKGDEDPTPPVVRSTPKVRTLTATSLAQALGEKPPKETLQATLSLYPDRVIRRALAATLAVPDKQIRRSRTALFLHLLNRYAEET